MASIGQIYYHVLDPGTGGLISNIDAEYLFSEGSEDVNKFHSRNIVAHVSDKIYFSKIGVQAPPGTQIVFNDEKIAVVGRTGIYDLDDVHVEKMWFVRPILYSLDEEATAEALITGEAGILKAWQNFQKTIEDKDIDLDYTKHDDYPRTGLTIAIANAYKKDYKLFRTAMAAYITAYTNALASFNRGDYGIYVPNEPGDLYNVVVDFIYESTN